MAINDRFMLPKRVRTMEQMADLLAAEQAELDQTQHTITALENQLIVSTSTYLLSRHEKLFALPVNTTESLEERRARVLARLNTHGITTIQAIKNLVEIMTGTKPEVVEHFEQYAFDLIIQNPCRLYNLFNLFGVLEQMKPAHLVFHCSIIIRPVEVLTHAGAVSSHCGMRMGVEIPIPSEVYAPHPKMELCAGAGAYGVHTKISTEVRLDGTLG